MLKELRREKFAFVLFNDHLNDFYHIIFFVLHVNASLIGFPYFYFR